MHAFPWLIFILLARVVVAYDPSLSNGTCYFGVNQKAADNFIPCGNAAGGVQSCCQARDICLSSNACFNGQFYVTYLAGCTDSNYADSSCPNKGLFPNQQWVGLVRCGISSGAGEEWGPCAESDQPKLNKGNQTCKCDPSQKTAVFTDAATLTNIASLPVSAGNAIAWYSGFTPSTTIADPTTTSGIATTTPTALSSTPSSTATAGSPSPTAISSGLSVGAKAGIGVGISVGALVIGLIFVAFIWLRRRKNRNLPPVHDQIRPSSLSPWEPGDHLGSAVENHKSWGGRSELPTEANEITTGKTSLGDSARRSTLNTPATTYAPYQNSPSVGASEVGGSPAASTVGLAPTKAMYEKPGHGGPIYEMPG